MKYKPGTTHCVASPTDECEDYMQYVMRNAALLNKITVNMMTPLNHIRHL